MIAPRRNRIKMSETMRQAAVKFKDLILGTSPSLARRGFRLSMILAVGFVVWFVPWVFTVPLGLSLSMPYEADGESRYFAFNGPVAGALGLGDWANAQEVPAACAAAVVAAEDTRFYEHRGVDWESLETAWDYNQNNLEKASSAKSKSKRSQRRSDTAAKVRGASTVTQQLVKNLYLSRDRSYLRKMREVVGALLLEPLVSKETILTWYLNVVEFGPRVYGIEAAARHYFRKSAKELLPHECVSLTVVLPSPNKWNASLVSRSYTPFFTKRYSVIVRRMQALGHVGPSTLRQVRSGVPFFFEAPHSAPDDPAEIELPLDPEPDSSLAEDRVPSLPGPLSSESGGPPESSAAPKASPQAAPEAAPEAAPKVAPEVAPEVSASPAQDSGVPESVEPAENQ
jgi:monofunctional biosynthetic peptidoglycan transglycosylase